MAENDWYEELPEDCPPRDAGAPVSEPHFRVVRTIPPTDCDFVSQRALYPERPFSVPECQARAVSLFLVRKSASGVLKLPRFKGGAIVPLTLPRTAGVTKKTGGKPGHVSWWRRANFDPVPLAVPVKLKRG